MNVINYCSGGLGNRLKPLSSCYAIRMLTGRKVGIVWQPTMRCQTHFHDLFKNDINELDNEALANLNSAVIFTEKPYITHDANLNNVNGLLRLSEKCPVISLTESRYITKCYDTENIVIYSNDYIDGYHKEHCIDFLRSLQPLDFIQTEINKFCAENDISKQVIGVHARGTDFEAGGNQLKGCIDAMRDTPGRFFVCSDSLDYENEMKNEFGDRVIFRKKNSYVYKENPNSNWTNNVQTPKESVQESLIDLYILSKTNLQIYNRNSTFAHIALDLGSI